jgi:hypothetical protein
MPKITNLFIKGLQRDLSISNNDNQSSIWSLDFDLVANNGESLGVPHNTKGNSLQFSIPDLPPVYTIELDGFTGSPSLLINGILNVFGITAETTILDVYNEIITNYAAYIALGQYGVFYNNNQVYIVGYTVDPAVAIGPPNNGLESAMIQAAVTDLSVLGWCLLDEDIIMVTTQRTNISSTPTNTDGQFWKITYDDATNTITNLTGTVLTPQYHLVKNDVLNFSLANEIYREMLGRVESASKGSVYGTDDYNNPFALNIYNTQAAAIPPGLLAWKPDVNMTTPLINGLLNGGNLKVGTYQAAYQTYSADGAITGFSPASMLIPVNEEPFGTTDYYQFDGAAEGTVGGKSIRINIPNIDTRYDYIRVAIIIYEIPDVPQIYTFVDQPITDSTMEFLFTGNENKILLTTAEFLNPNISFDTCKSIAQKKNRLYPTNTTTTNFDIDWDARAYRFNSVGDYALYSRSSTTPLSGTGVDAQLIALPDTADAVNPYNDESGQVYGLFPANVHSDWLNATTQQFKYQTNGTTFGGEGVNLSYSFFIKDYVGDNTLTSIPSQCPFVNVTSVNAGGTTQDIFNPNITELEPTIEGWDSIKNPLYSMVFPSYCRGEVYRFGIVFYNNKGQQSFTKWIGDIKIPEPWEDADFELSAVSGTDLLLRAIGINFSIDTSSLPTDITGFRIVRCNRTDDDKTRFGTGLTCGLWSTDVKLANTVLFTPAWTLGRKREPGGGVTETSWLLELNAEYNVLETDSLGIIKFPDNDFGIYQVGQASHIKKLASYSVTNDITTAGSFVTPATIYWASNLNTASATPWMHAVLHKANTNSMVPGVADVIVSIGAQTGVGIDGIVLGSTSGFVMGGIDFHNVIPFQDIALTQNDVCSLGTKSLFCYFDSTVYGDTMTGTVDEYQVISLCRFNQGQYGGPWRAARYNNVYQACSDFIPIALYDATLQALDVFGGDTYVNYYSTELSFFHWKEDYGVPTATPSGLAGNYDPVSATQLAIAIAFPTESSINTDLRHGEYFNKNQVNQYVDATGTTINDADVFAKFLSDDYSYNLAYSQENNIVPYLAKPFLIDDSEDNRVRTWASEFKFDREDIDSWRKYKEYIDLEGMYGESVKISNVNEKLIVHQNRGVAQISSEELATVPNGQGQVLESGTGRLLSRYDYISKETGAFHQHAVITSPSSVYHFDSRLMKLYKMGGGLEALTDVKGLSAFFRKYVVGNMRTTDQVLLDKGIHGVFDTMYNKAYFTFERTVDFTYTARTVTANPTTTVYTGDFEYLIDIYRQGQTIIINNNEYVIVSVSAIQLILSGNSNIPREGAEVNVKFTIAYNEFLQAFESFYSFTPNIYLGTGKRLFSANPYDYSNSVYEHNIGNFGEFYDQTPSNSILQYITNYPDQTKIPTFRLDTMEFWTEVIDNQNQHITLESITGLVVENNNQTTGNSLNPLTLGPQGNFTSVDVEQTWRINRFFDYTNPALTLKPYLRDKFTKTTIYYDNALNRDFKLHNISSNITLSY